MFLGSKKNPCYFCAFNFEGFSGPFLAFSLYKSRIFFKLVILATLVIFASDCRTKFSSESFLLRKFLKNLLSNFSSQDPSWTYLNSYETPLILLELNCLTFLKRTLAVFKNGKMKTNRRYERVEPDRG